MRRPRTTTSSGVSREPAAAAAPSPAAAVCPWTAPPPDMAIENSNRTLVLTVVPKAPARYIDYNSPPAAHVPFRAHNCIVGYAGNEDAGSHRRRGNGGP